MLSLKEKRDQALIAFIKNSDFHDIVALLEKILLNRSFTPRLSFVENQPHRYIAGIYNILHEEREIAARNKFAIQVISLYDTEVKKGAQPYWIFELLESISIMHPRVVEMNILVNHFIEKKLVSMYYGSIQLHDQLLAILCHANYIDADNIKDEIVKTILQGEVAYQKVALRFLFNRGFHLSYLDCIEGIINQSIKTQTLSVHIVESLFEYAVYKNDYRLLFDWVYEHNKEKYKPLLNIINSRIQYPWMKAYKYAMLIKLELQDKKTLPIEFLLDIYNGFKDEIREFVAEPKKFSDAEKIKIINLIIKRFNTYTINFKEPSYILEDNEIRINPDFRAPESIEVYKTTAADFNITTNWWEHIVAVDPKDYEDLNFLSVSLPIEIEENALLGSGLNDLKNTKL